MGTKLRLGVATMMVAAAALAAAQGCSGSTTSGGDGGVVSVPVAADQFASSYAHAVCDNLGPCCSANNFGYDANGCMAAVQGLVQAEVINAAKAAGATYDANAAGQCVALAQQGSQACAQTAENKAALNATCSRVYSGTKQPGEACKSGVECAASTEGRVSCTSWFSGSGDGGSSQGQMCTLRKSPAKVGDACGGASNGGAPPAVTGDCESASSELQCDFTTHTCQARAAIGQKCTSSGACVKDAYCNFSKQTCDARLAAGQPCSGIEDCATGAYCDTQGSKTCVATKAAGAACQSGSECEGGSCKGGKCLANSVGVAELCGAAK